MQNNSMKSATRGGQTLLHNLRMMNQILNKVFIWALPVGLFVAWAWFISATTPYQRYIGSQWISAELYALVGDVQHQQTFILESGKTVKVYPTQVIQAPFVKDAVAVLIEKGEHSLWAGLMTYLLTVVGILTWLRKRGDQQSRSKHIKGVQLLDAGKVKKVIRRKGKASQLVIGREKLPLPLYSETQHFLFHGTTGTGKSTAIKEFLDWIRSRGERAIIYDKGCDMVKQFYDEKMDVILNPWDKRSRDWNLWRECRDKAEFDHLNTALPPMAVAFVKDSDQSFSIRQWMRDDEEQGWLFMPSLGDKHESLKPLIAAWLDIAINTLLSLPENAERRIWVILDELASLPQLPDLISALSEVRKFGGCFIIGVQSYAQLIKIYGHNAAQEVSSLLNTRFMFRAPDPDIAQWSAKNLGRITLEEVREGISYGANTIRDGVSINRVETEKPIVTDSDIMHLDDLTCYVKLAGQYPVTLLHIPYVHRPDRSNTFEPREFANDDDLHGEFIDLKCAQDKNNLAKISQVMITRGINENTAEIPLYPPRAIRRGGGH